MKRTTAVVGLGLRGVDKACAALQIIHQSEFKSLDAKQRRWLKRHVLRKTVYRLTARRRLCKQPAAFWRLQLVLDPRARKRRGVERASGRTCALLQPSTDQDKCRRLAVLT